MKEFIVTEYAGNKLGTIENPGEGEIVVMTDEQAEHFVRTLQLKPKPKSKEKKAEKPAKEKAAK